MFENILVTIDLNHEASWLHALPTAVQLARASGGKIHAMTVVPDFGTAQVAGFFPANFREKALAKANIDLQQLLEAQIPSDISVTPHVAYGPVHEEILKAIETTGADLVVMASHAPDRIREFLVGSQADRVVRRSPVSVLVTRG